MDNFVIFMYMRTILRFSNPDDIACDHRHRFYFGITTESEVSVK